MYKKTSRLLISYCFGWVICSETIFLLHYIHYVCKVRTKDAKSFTNAHSYVNICYVNIWNLSNFENVKITKRIPSLSCYACNLEWMSFFNRNIWWTYLIEPHILMYVVYLHLLLLKIHRYTKCIAELLISNSTIFKRRIILL